MKLNVSLKDWKNAQNILSLEVPAALEQTVRTGIDFIDEAYGGSGVTPSTVTLFTGTPGAGKSTLSLQLANSLTGEGHICLYNTGEESLFQVRRVCKRLGLRYGFIAGQDTMVDNVLAHARELKKLHPQKHLFMVFDSLQTLDDGKYANGLTNSMTQVRVTEMITDFCKETMSCAVIVGQVTKEGEFAGKQAVKHAVDVHMHLSVDLQKKSDTYGQRIFEIQKNRFGSAGKRFLVGLSERGLVKLDEIE